MINNQRLSVLYFVFREYRKRPVKNKSSHQRCSLKKVVLRNLTKFTGKHLCQGLFFNEETLTQVFSCEICEIFKNTFFAEHLWTTASRRRTYFGFLWGQWNECSSNLKCLHEKVFWSIIVMMILLELVIRW